MMLTPFLTAAMTATCAAIATAIPAMAQDADACLLLNDAMERAALRDPGADLAAAQRDAAAANVSDARALRRPQVSAFGRTGIGDSDLVENRIENQVGLRVSQRVFDFGDSAFARRAALESVAASEFTMAAAKQDAALRAGLAFFTVQEAYASLIATQERTAYFRRELGAVEALLARGGATRPERAEVAAELAASQALTLEWEFIRDRAMTQVALAAELDTPPCANGDRHAADLGDVGLQPAQVSVRDAMTRNPTVRALGREIDSLTASRDRERRNRLPVLDVVGVAAYTYDDFTGAWELRDRVGVDVSVPIYSGAALRAQVERADARLSEAVARRRAAERQLEQDVRIAHRRVASLAEQYVFRRRVEIEKSNQFAAAEREHERGLLTLPDLVEIRLEFEDAALAAIRAHYDLQRQRLQLASLTGGLAQHLALNEPAEDPTRFATLILE